MFFSTMKKAEVKLQINYLVGIIKGKASQQTVEQSQQQKLTSF